MARVPADREGDAEARAYFAELHTDTPKLADAQLLLAEAMRVLEAHGGHD